MSLPPAETPVTSGATENGSKGGVLAALVHCHATMLIMRPEHARVTGGGQSTRQCEPDAVGKAFGSLEIPSWEHPRHDDGTTNTGVEDIGTWWAQDELVLHDLIRSGRIDSEIPAGAVLVGHDPGVTADIADLLNPGTGPMRTIEAISGSSPLADQPKALLAVTLYPVPNSSNARCFLAIALAEQYCDARNLTVAAVNQFSRALAAAPELRPPVAELPTDAMVLGALEQLIGLPQFVDIAVETTAPDSGSASLRGLEPRLSTSGSIGSLLCAVELSLPAKPGHCLPQVIRHLGPIGGYNVATVASEALQASHHLEQIRKVKEYFSRDFKQIAALAPDEESMASQHRALRIKVEHLNVYLSEARGTLGQLAVNAGNVQRAATNACHGTDALARAEGFTVRAERAHRDAELIIGQMAGDLQVKLRVLDRGERTTAERLVQSQAGVTGLLAGVAATLAVFELKGNPWWGVFAGIALFAAAAIWIGRDLPYRRIHVLPVSVATMALSAAATTSFMDYSAGRLVTSLLVGGIVGYLGGHRLLRSWDQLGSNDGMSWRRPLQAVMAYVRDILKQEVVPLDGQPARGVRSSDQVAMTSSGPEGEGS